jgi:metal-responsive CopG/Arc/MetJ family transcriptional regulator
MVKVPLELLRQVDILVKRFDYGSREVFVEAAIRRVINYHSLTLPPLKQIVS